MDVELPFAPVEEIIRRNAGELRVSTEAVEELARRLQSHGMELAMEAGERATEEGRKTLMAADLVSESVPDRDELALPIAPVDRIVRLGIDDHFGVAMAARIAVASLLESFADTVAGAAAVLAQHADRRTVQAADIEAYFELQQYFDSIDL